MWFVEDGLPASQTIGQGLEREGESSTLLGRSEQDAVDTLRCLMNTVLRHWYMFTVIFGEVVNFVIWQIFQKIAKFRITDTFYLFVKNYKLSNLKNC